MATHLLQTKAAVGRGRALGDCRTSRARRQGEATIRLEMHSMTMISTGDTKNIYGQKYWEYMGRQSTEILEKAKKYKKKLTNKEKNKKT